MEQVQQALAVQLSPTSPGPQIKEANVWLHQFQGTKEAWQVADQLLSLDAAGNGLVGAAHTFAALTMRTKIQYDFAELPADSHDALRSSLLSHVVRFAAGPKPVLTQLCLAVALLALHMESWLTVVPDLIRNLTQPAEHAAVKLPCLLELLTVLPEEVENFKVGIMPRRRQQFREMLKHAGAEVLALLVQVCEQCRAQDAIMEGQMRCVSSWLRNAWLPSDQLAASPILSFAFASMGSKALFDTAADLLVDAVHFSHNHEEHTQLITAIVPQVLQLVPQYEAGLAAEDKDVCKPLCRVFTEMGEQYLHLILQSPEQWALPVVGAVLRGASYPDSDVAQITFNFWYILSEQIAGDEERTYQLLAPPQRAQCRELFAPVYAHLVDALRLRVELPPEAVQPGQWTEDERDEFKRFRYSVGDVLSDACKVMTSVRCLQRVFAVLQAKLPELAAAPQEHWRGVEGCVYCMRQMVVANRAAQGEPAFFCSDVVSNFMRLLPTLPPVGELQSTCIRTVGTYANWFNQNAELLPQMLSYVAQGLTGEKVAAASAQSMRQLCEACASHLADEASMSQLLQMYHGTLRLPLHNADRVDLISALAFVVSQLEVTQMLPAMQAIAQPRVARLREVLAQGGGANEVANLLEELCALLSRVNPKERPSTDTPHLQDAPHPSVQMLLDLWEVLNLVFAQHGADTRCMERLCRCYKHTARNCQDGFTVVLPRLLPQVTQWFEVQPHSCFLYVCNVCMGHFGQSRELAPLFGESFKRMSAATFQLLSVTSSIVEHPDVVDDFFELSSKALKVLPALLLESEMLVTVFHCGCAGLHVEQREANRSVVNFFETLVKIASNERARACVSPAGLQALLGVLTAHGSQLVHAMVFAIAGVLPSQRIRFIVPVLKMLVDMEPNTCRAWVSAAVQALPADAHIDGGTLLKTLFSPEALGDEQAFRNAIDAFSSACRRKRIL